MKLLARVLACARATACTKWRRVSKVQLSIFLFSNIKTGEKEVKFNFQEKKYIQMQIQESHHI